MRHASKYYTFCYAPYQMYSLTGIFEATLPMEVEWSYLYDEQE